MYKLKRLIGDAFTYFYGFLMTNLLLISGQATSILIALSEGLQLELVYKL